MYQYVEGGVFMMMVHFIFAMLGCFVFFGVVAVATYRGLARDTYRYDKQFIWDRSPATLEQMELDREPK
jgi:hypothetical protein